MAYEHVLMRLKAHDKYVHVEPEGRPQDIVSLCHDKDIYDSQTAYGTHPDRVVLTVVGSDRQDVREMLDEVVEQTREDFAISAMDFLGCGTADLIIYECWCKCRCESWGLSKPLVWTTQPLYIQSYVVYLAAVRKSDGPCRVEVAQWIGDIPWLMNMPDTTSGPATSPRMSVER